jgi:hypothetical protein
LRSLTRKPRSKGSTAANGGAIDECTQTSDIQIFDVADTNRFVNLDRKMRKGSYFTSEDANTKRMCAMGKVELDTRMPNLSEKSVSSPKTNSSKNGDTESTNNGETDSTNNNSACSKAPKDTKKRQSPDRDTARTVKKLKRSVSHNTLHSSTPSINRNWSSSSLVHVSSEPLLSSANLGCKTTSIYNAEKFNNRRSFLQDVSNEANVNDLEYMMQYGFNVNNYDETHHTILDYAQSSNRNDIVDFIKRTNSGRSGNIDFTESKDMYDNNYYKNKSMLFI